METGDLAAAQALAGPGRGPRRRARRSRIGRRTRCTAAACWTTTPPGCCGRRSATATPAGRCCSAKALEAAAGEFVAADDRGQARAAFTQAVEIYASLGAAADVARLQARFRAHGIRRGPHSKHRQARSGWDSLTPTETKVAALVGGGTVQPGDRRQAVAVPADGRDPRLPHPEEARRAFAHRHRPRGGAAHHRVEVTAAGVVCRGRRPRRASVHEREVHGLARRGRVEAPLARQAGDQHQAPAGLPRRPGRAPVWAGSMTCRGHRPGTGRRRS